MTSKRVSNFRELATYLLHLYDGRICLSINEGWNISKDLMPEFAKELRELLRAHREAEG